MIVSLVKQSLLGVEITNATSKEILEYIMDFLRSDRKPIYIVTPNPEIIVRATRKPVFKEILNKAELALPDGVGVLLGGQILGKPFKERVTGTDLIEDVCKRVVNEGKSDVRKPITMGFLGAGLNVALKVSECLARRYPGLDVVFAGEEWPGDARGPVRSLPTSARSSLPSRSEVANDLRSDGSPASATPLPKTKDQRLKTDAIDILFVALGAPKQEEWMDEHIGKLPVRIMVGVGGALDYLSGRVPRAPKLLRSLGLEWLYRLIREPWRAKRQLALVEYIWLILIEKIRNSNIETRNPSTGSG